MRCRICAVAFGIALGMQGASFADQMQDMKDMQKPSPSAAAAVHKATGVVKCVKPEAGQVTLDHGPVPSLN